MFKLLKRMPEEIIDKIFAYTYSPQSPKLMEDVRNYVKTFDEISYIYYNYWVEGLPFPVVVQTNQDKQWLFRDLFNNHNEWDSKPFSKKGLDFLIKKLFTRNEDEETRIRLIWGILKPEQRENFVTSRKKLMIDGRLEIIKSAF